MIASFGCGGSACNSSVNASSSRGSDPDEVGRYRYLDQRAAREGLETRRFPKRRSQVPQGWASGASSGAPQRVCSPVSVPFDAVSPCPFMTRSVNIRPISRAGSTWSASTRWSALSLDRSAEMLTRAVRQPDIPVLHEQMRVQRCDVNMTVLERHPVSGSHCGKLSRTVEYFSEQPRTVRRGMNDGEHGRTKVFREIGNNRTDCGQSTRRCAHTMMSGMNDATV